MSACDDCVFTPRTLGGRPGSRRYSASTQRKEGRMADSVTSRALDLLGAFDADHRSLRLSDLARRSGTPLATAHRLVAELRKWGALAREPNGEYVIGRRIWQL